MKNLQSNWQTRLVDSYTFFFRAMGYIARLAVKESDKSNKDPSLLPFLPSWFASRESLKDSVCFIIVFLTQPFSTCTIISTWVP